MRGSKGDWYIINANNSNNDDNDKQTRKKRKKYDGEEKKCEWRRQSRLISHNFRLIKRDKLTMRFYVISFRIVL